MAEAYELGKNDLVVFRQLFMPVENEVPAAWFHHEWGNVLLHGKKHYAVEGFRESAKSSYVLRAYPLHCLVYPKKKNNYIVFIMANQRTASKKLKEIAEEYMSNELFNLNLVKEKERSEKAFEVVVTDENNEEVSVRIEAYGKGAAVRGLNSRDRRPSIIIIDDPQDLSDSLSDTIQDNDYDWFLSDVIFLGRNTRIFFIGNNLGEKCLIERVIANKDLLKFEAVRIPVINEDGKSNWEEMYPVEAVEKEKKIGVILGNWIFGNEKKCVLLYPLIDSYLRKNISCIMTPRRCALKTVQSSLLLTWLYQKRRQQTLHQFVLWRSMAIIIGSYLILIMAGMTRRKRLMLFLIKYKNTTQSTLV